MDWSAAFFRLAQSDFAMFERLQATDDVPLHHRLHYLQMASEKVAKAYLPRMAGQPPDRTHRALVTFLRWAAINRGFHQRYRSSLNGRAFSLLVQSLIGVAEQLQALSPEGEDHPNTEYPWLNAQGDIESPLDYAFGELDLDRNLRVIRLVEFLRGCVEADF